MAEKRLLLSLLKALVMKVQLGVFLKNNVRVTERRNEHKSEIMFKLSSTGKILVVRPRVRRRTRKRL